MRQVTEKTCNAFLAGESTRCGNTATVIDNGEILLVLHGKTIAKRTLDDNSIVWATLAGWPTVTTRDRLNGLCHKLQSGKFFQSKGEQYYTTPQGDVPIDCHDWIRIFTHV
jgi:hypothetical protein